MINKIETDSNNSQSISSIDNEIAIEKEKKYTLKTKITIKFDLLNEEFNSNIALSDLKKHINTKFHIQENEYRLLIGESLISDISNDTLVSSLLYKYKENNIIIKTYKNIIDVKKDLINYENILSKKISSKEEEIKLLVAENEKLKDDLQKFE